MCAKMKLPDSKKIISQNAVNKAIYIEKLKFILPLDIHLKMSGRSYTDDK